MPLPLDADELAVELDDELVPLLVAPPAELDDASVVDVTLASDVDALDADAAPPALALEEVASSGVM